jgi:REP-associated tyrosine transposase
MPDWPHAPLHRVSEAGAYIITAGTYRKRHILDTPAKLDLVRDALFHVALAQGWELQAWAVLSNHYHLVAAVPDEADLSRFIHSLHRFTSRELNKIDRTSGRRVWHQCWDTHLTYERSYLARLNYVHTNPVHHGVVEDERSYPWCSAAWFVREADAALRKTVESFKTDRVNVPDEF